MFCLKCKPHSISPDEKYVFQLAGLDKKPAQLTMNKCIVCRKQARDNEEFCENCCASDYVKMRKEDEMINDLLGVNDYGKDDTYENWPR